MKPQVALFVREYLRQAPLFMAIVRGVECAIVRRAEPLRGPVLDLGCGDGLFATLACTQPPTLGLDPSQDALREARARAPGQAFSCGSATEMPLRSGAVNTILCNSVMEHIPDLDGALAECRRVLATGGRLLLTSPSERFGALLWGTRLLASLGLRGAADGYTRWFNEHSRHYHTLTLEEWRRRLEQHGFTVRESWQYLNGDAHGVFDLMHYASLWRWLRRRFTGRWVGRHAPLNAVWSAWFVRLTDDAWPCPGGPYLFIDAERKD